MNLIRKYFPDLSPEQSGQLEIFRELIRHWNTKINLVSRKDIRHLEERHILHSLAIARAFTFPDGCSILDVGTGGGFPGVPLAIYFPRCRFTLIDSIGKKIRAVDAVCSELKLGNVNTVNARIENYYVEYDYVVARAVTGLARFNSRVRKNYTKGLIYLAGGDLEKETGNLPGNKIFNISDFYQEAFFESKKIVCITK